MDVNQLFSVKGKVVLITGGANGIGRMMAEGFVANGARVYLMDRDTAACATTVAELTQRARHGASAHALPADLLQLAECEAAVARLRQLEPAGRLHVLVHGAGVAWSAPVDTYPDAAWSAVLTLNLQRVFSLTQLCLPLLTAAATPADPARLIHLGSIDGLRAPPLPVYAYAASKAGLHQLSRSLARDLGRRHVTSNVLACGPFPTAMMQSTLEAAGDYIRDELPLGRVGQPVDAAGAALFLASKAGAWCTGALIRVDGGASLVSKL